MLDVFFLKNTLVEQSLLGNRTGRSPLINIGILVYRFVILKT